MCTCACCWQVADTPALVCVFDGIANVQKYALTVCDGDLELYSGSSEERRLEFHKKRVANGWIRGFMGVAAVLNSSCEPNVEVGFNPKDRADTTVYAWSTRAISEGESLVWGMFALLTSNLSASSADFLTSLLCVVVRVCCDNVWCMARFTYSTSDYNWSADVMRERWGWCRCGSSQCKAPRRRKRSRTAPREATREEAPREEAPRRSKRLRRRK